MVDARVPRTVSELRLACVGWPQEVVRQVVRSVVPEPDAALFAAWLVDSEPSIDEPPISAEMVRKIWERLQSGSN
jgi:hypothetical protein